MTEDRPHRPALTRRRRAARCSTRSTPAASDALEVDAVLAAAGQASRNRPGGPPGGAHRARGRRAAPHRPRPRQQAGGPQLGISPKTVGHHIEHIYAKAGVTTRAGATLFAMEHGLLSP